MSTSHPDNRTDDAPDSDCLYCLDNLHAYALGALEPEEVDCVEKHVARCPACREELDHIESVVKLLPLASRPVTPPPSVKAGLLARVASGEQGHAADPVVLASPWAQPSQEIAAETATTGVSWQRWAFPAIVAPLVLGLIVLLAWSNSLQNQLEALREAPDSTRNQIAEAAAAAIPYELTLYQFEPACPDCDDTPAAGQLGGHPNANVGVVVAWNLDPTQKHEVWCVNKQGERLRISDLEVAGNGNVVQTVSFPEALSGYDQIYVTRNDGSTEPDTELMISMNEALAPERGPGTPEDEADTT